MSLKHLFIASAISFYTSAVQAEIPQEIRTDQTTPFPDSIQFSNRIMQYKICIS